MGATLTKLTLRGFKSIRVLEDFRPASLNILIGPNGAGKSNFISFFRMLSWMTTEALQMHVAQSGGAASFLYDGPQVTGQMEASLCLTTDEADNDYMFRLAHAAGDNFIFTEEKYRFSKHEYREPYHKWNPYEPPYRESRLAATGTEESGRARVLSKMLQKCVVHQFHDTSSRSPMRTRSPIGDSMYLKEDGRNLPAFLLRLETEYPEYYGRVVGILRTLLPFFQDFVLEPEGDHVMLRWRERGASEVFSAFQASDGMLRLMALVAMLGQPPSFLPFVLILDEPELGLHPAAIQTVAGMLKNAAQHCQIFAATQSADFINHFEAGDIVVVEREDRESTFRRLSSADLEVWMEDYCLAELWEKNILGGLP